MRVMECWDAHVAANTGPAAELSTATHADAMQHRQAALHTPFHGASMLVLWLPSQRRAVSIDLHPLD